MSLYRNQLEGFLQKLDVKANRVLDVGGAALPVKGRTKSWEVEDYKILDICTEDVKQKPDIEYDLNFDIDDYNWDLPLTGDIVFCLEVFEYVSDPVRAMVNLWKLTKQGGTLYVTFPTIYPIHHPVEIDYLRYSLAWIRTQMFRWKGYDVFRRVVTTGRKPLEQFYKAEGLHPVKHDAVIFDMGYLIVARK